jgi:hypothetical protein
VPFREELPLAVLDGRSLQSTAKWEMPSFLVTIPIQCGEGARLRNCDVQGVQHRSSTGPNEIHNRDSSKPMGAAPATTNQWDARTAQT